MRFEFEIRFRWRITEFFKLNNWKYRSNVVYRLNIAWNVLPGNVRNANYTGHILVGV